MSTTEVWRPIPEWPGYSVSNEGRVRSHVRSEDGVLLTARVNPSNGYLTVGPTRNKKQSWVPIHVLVALAFHGPRPDGNVVRHLDSDPYNNRPENLAWGTYAENSQDMVQHLGAHPSTIRAATLTHCKKGHPFSDANSMPITKKGGVKGRRCRVCYCESMVGVAQRNLAAARAAIEASEQERAA